MQITQEITGERIRGNGSSDFSCNLPDKVKTELDPEGTEPVLLQNHSMMCCAIKCCYKTPSVGRTLDSLNIMVYIDTGFIELNWKTNGTNGTLLRKNLFYGFTATNSAKDHYFDVVTGGIGAAFLATDFISGLIQIGGHVSTIGSSTYLVLRHDLLIPLVFFSLALNELTTGRPELPEDLPLIEAHAIGESLQIKIEELPEVERAFVHLDYECDQKPEHTISKLPNSDP
ncbi:metal tolerance protein 4 [Phtheirospermum japonicum]|uniref:Metal tolerance protein 4 n=1 Tax=Phtheirospermum japonicum TaxID=374723 RepID=A0A830CQA2_9LAMI|nr:metal tolerance protein 4 [Phtheirospermum japonicum]